ncbi:basal body-orientation factor 1 isoform X2 [Homo sapiens]|uniref:basal body-orientation factor 1 isoform X2 n=1 Tax=Homo sapiens TaxID=9606 RepID=UPI0005D001DA|nr:basal body-orientation factor 1 isoform X2 [Homo sapiens]|eukprot:XP_011535473.1 basal body-orientation factor 1 isoform X2 [Homo sapiens]
MPSKGKDKKKGKSKGKDTKKLIKTDESVVDRAKANASLWEARLEVTELSRIKYRDTSRILAKSNEDLKKKQCKMEKDIMSVLSYLKKQDQEKDNMIEKLKQQLNETKEKAQEEKDKLEQKYTRQINELEGQFHQKAKEIGMIHTELKAVRQFQKRKIQVERELDDLKENLRNTERIHQETLRRLESRFFEEKHRLEQEAEKKIIMLAERAHHEAIVQLNDAGRNVFKENDYLQKALAYHLKETDALQKNSQKLQESHTLLLHQKSWSLSHLGIHLAVSNSPDISGITTQGFILSPKGGLEEINDLLVKEKIMQLVQQRSQIQTLQKKVVNLETALSYMTKEFESEVLKLQQHAMIENQAGQVEIDKLQHLLQMKDREMNRVKKLAKNILDERTEVERFFLDALHQVKQQILISRKHYKQIAQAAFNLKMRAACTGRTEYPKIRTFDGREHSTNSVNQDLLEAEKWTHIEGNVDIGDLTWEQKEKVLRLLFAKMNGCPSRKYNQSSRPPVPDYVVSDSGETKEFGDESKLQDKIFITQQIAISDSSGEVVLPTIPKEPQESDTVRRNLLRSTDYDLTDAAGSPFLAESLLLNIFKKIS